MKTYIADFETTTNPDDCRVWAYAICEVGNENNTIVGTSLDEFMKWCRNNKSNPKVMFHNLKFDGQFIMQWLFHNGFEHTEKPEDKKTGTFNTMISNKGMYYQIEVIFYKKGKNVSKVVFQDSLKLIPLSVDAIAKAFDMDINKLEIDYKAHDNLPPGSPLTPEEEEYIKHDVKIVARAVEYFYSQGLKKMTIGACALDEYKKLITKRNFERWFPPPQYHDDVKQSYKGGFTYLLPKYRGRQIEKGLVLDVNSLYPSVMFGADNEYMPFGTPIFFQGKYKEDKIYPLYTQMFRCQFQLKRGKIPTIQIKHGHEFKGNEYLTNSGDSEVVLCLNSVDLKLFYEHYDVFNEEWISGWKFKASHGNGLFNKYIEKWSNNKIQAKKDGNRGLYLISKLFLNSLYGKFGTDNKIISKIPYLGKDDIIHFRKSDEEEKDGIYIAMASFITSWARLKTIKAGQKLLDNFNSGKSKACCVYFDTDSIHVDLNGVDEEEFLKTCGLDIDEYKIGAWDHEMPFKRGKYLRQKCYIEEEIITEKDYEKGIKEDDKFLYSKDDEGFYRLKITVAGMPSRCYSQVNFDNFKMGATYKGKLQPKNVKGGVILADVEFTLKE